MQFNAIFHVTLTSYKEYNYELMKSCVFAIVYNTIAKTVDSINSSYVSLCRAKITFVFWLMQLSGSVLSVAYIIQSI